MPPHKSIEAWIATIIVAHVLLGTSQRAIAQSAGRGWPVAVAKSGFVSGSLEGQGNR